MKRTVFNRFFLTVVVLFSCFFFMKAASPNNYIYDVKEENGKMVSKTVFVQKDGLLNKEVKYEFSYNTEGLITEKKMSRWDASKENWVPYFLITYAYSDDTIQSVYAMWDAKSKTFSINKQEMTMSRDNYDDIFS